MTRLLGYKNYAAIFVRSEEDRAKIIDVLRDIDEEEYKAYYCGDKLIQVLNPEIDTYTLTYTQKYEPPAIKFYIECLKRNIPVFVIISQQELWNVLY